jgi:hypothetical protein
MTAEANHRASLSDLNKPDRGKVIIELGNAYMGTPIPVVD